MEDEKPCTKCNITKPLKDYYFRKSLNRHENYCKECIKARSNKNYRTMDQEQKTKVLEGVRERGKAYRESGREKMVKDKWREENKEKVRAYKRRYRHSEKAKEKRRQPDNVIRESVSNLVRYALRQVAEGKKTRSTFDALPYSPQDLKEHLEGLFQEGMSWDNYGEWNIDHIIPQSALPYEDLDDENFQKCWALENLQPLWAAENSSKGSLHEGIRHRWRHSITKIAADPA